MPVVLSEFGRLARVVVKHARDAFVDSAESASQWQALNFSAPPDLGRAIANTIDSSRSCGRRCEGRFAAPRPADDARFDLRARRVDRLPDGDDSLQHGQTGARGRAGGAGRRPGERGPVAIAGRIEPPGRLEGGDVCGSTTARLSSAAGIGPTAKASDSSARYSARRRPRRGAVAALARRATSCT